MATVFVTPNMNLPSPVPGQEQGPQWSTDNYNCFSQIDSHNHTSGQGVPIPPGGLNINADLPFGNNNATGLRSVRFMAQVSQIPASGSDLLCLSVSSADLYYNDGNGNQIRITQGGSLAGAAGTITGLPSGTASASYASVSGTFVFQQATSTAANVDVGTLILRYPGSYPTPSGNYIALQAPTSLSSGFAFTLPAALPGSSSFMYVSSGGQFSYTQLDNSTLANNAGIIEVAPNGITAAQIANATITGTQIASNINLPGKFVEIGGQSAVCSANPGTNGLIIIRGQVASNGSIVSGEGFTVTFITTGNYVINFNASFSDKCAFIATAINNLAAANTVQTNSGSNYTSSVGVFTLQGGTLTSQPFSFIAIGQRA